MTSTGEIIVSFSNGQRLFRLFTYNLPALALIWFLLRNEQTARALARPSPRDLLICGFSLAALIVIASLLSALSSLLTPQSITLEPPDHAVGWLVLCLSCLGTGYLEESWFRLYLPLKLRNAGMVSGTASALSTLLFALCHRYEGFWGVLNAALAGAVLSFLLWKKRSFHGIALAHALYNTLGYL
ncbi:MAG: CPBP family intramembrane metalloprotease [Treponema sp.]|jgi:membrane protease YdiL (CAAX protease family)|nr:CPBP family intramembrane metalloprotease [Treponema sp.]